jgi:hypothetical protein
MRGAFISAVAHLRQRVVHLSQRVVHLRRVVEFRSWELAAGLGRVTNCPWRQLHGGTRLADHGWGRGEGLAHGQGRSGSAW